MFVDLLLNHQAMHCVEESYVKNRKTLLARADIAKNLRNISRVEKIVR